MKVENSSDLVKSLILLEDCHLSLWSLYLLHPFSIREIKYPFMKGKEIWFCPYLIFTIKYIYHICKWHLTYIRKIESAFKMTLKGMQQGGKRKVSCLGLKNQEQNIPDIMEIRFEGRPCKEIMKRWPNAITFLGFVNEMNIFS